MIEYLEGEMMSVSMGFDQILLEELELIRVHVN